MLDRLRQAELYKGIKTFGRKMCLPLRLIAHALRKEFAQIQCMFSMLVELFCCFPCLLILAMRIIEPKKGALLQNNS